jgi:hypothetical protein
MEKSFLNFKVLGVDMWDPNFPDLFTGSTSRMATYGPVGFTLLDPYGKYEPSLTTTSEAFAQNAFSHCGNYGTTFGRARSGV